MIRGLIFDFDGLILDTEVPSYESWQEIYREHGHELPMSEWAKCVGTLGAFDPVTYLESLHDTPLDRGHIEARADKRHKELIQVQVVLPGVEAYITEAKEMGLKLAVASGSGHQWVDGHLERLGLRHYFEATLCREDVARVKPDPALYNAALATLGLAADEAIVFEDSPNGLLAANRAGIFCVAVPNAITGQLPLDHADLRLTSMADMPLRDLLQRVNSRIPK